MSGPAPLRRLFALAADAGVRATAATRLLALAGAPVSLYLAATRLAPGMQGYYFVAINIVALAQLFETGMGTIVVQFASHEWPRLRWGAKGGLEGEPAARDAVAGMLRAALRWFGIAGLALFAIAGLGGFALYGSAWRGAKFEFGVLWCGCVALTAAYLLVVPFVCVAEGCGELVAVQRMRSWQVGLSFVAIWTGIVMGGPLLAAWLGAAGTAGRRDDRGFSCATPRCFARRGRCRPTSLPRTVGCLRSIAPSRARKRATVARALPHTAAARARTLLRLPRR